MKTMIVSDFITMRNSMSQLAVINLVCAAFIAAMTQSVLAGASALAVMVPFMYVFSILAYDEMNGWERFRLTLPIGRRQVVLGRYAGILLLSVISGVVALTVAAAFELFAGTLPAGTLPEGLLLPSGDMPMLVSAVALAIAVVVGVAAFTLPLFMRFGMTKATRIVPIVMVMLIAGGIYLGGDLGVFSAVVQGLSPVIGDVFSDPGASALLLGGSLLLVMVVLFAGSAVLAVKMYEGRQF